MCHGVGASSTCFRGAECEPIYDVPGSPAFFVQGYLTPLPDIQAQVRWWLSGHHASEVPGSKRPSEGLEIGYFDSYAADNEGKGD